MARKASLIGKIADIDGAKWDVRESRPTRHGFDLYFGWPEGLRGPGCGGPRLIPTQSLFDYWDKHRLTRDGEIYDLPAGRTTIKRVRSLLGLDFYCDNAEWWLNRIDDLSSMPGIRFAQVHGVCGTTVSEMRARLVGKRLRAPGWWREPSNAELLAGELPRAYVAARLDISVGTVGRLRWLLRKSSK